MNTLLSNYKIRSAQLADLVTLAEIERAAAALFALLTFCTSTSQPIKIASKLAQWH